MMAIEQGKYGLWYSKGVGFATKDQAQAHEDEPIKTPHPAAKDSDKKSSAAWVWVIGASAILILGAVIASNSKSTSSSQSKKADSDAQLQEIKYQRLAREQVIPYLKDPESAQFRNQTGFCGEVNAKNSLGGYSGFKRFIAGGKDMVFLEDDKRLEAGAFQSAWNQFCR